MRGNAGAYVWTAGRLAGDAEGRRVEGFAMLQVAPRESRSLQPLAVQAGLSAFGWVDSRPADAVNLAVASGVFSDDSGLEGAETVVELNYRYVLNEAVVIRPDVQYVFNPGGLHDDALVLGVQLEFGL